MLLLDLEPVGIHGYHVFLEDSQKLVAFGEKFKLDVLAQQISLDAIFKRRDQIGK